MLPGQADLPVCPHPSLILSSSTVGCFWDAREKEPGLQLVRGT